MYPLGFLARSVQEKQKRREAESSTQKTAMGNKQRELLVPNSHNGADMEDYSWEQNPHPLPFNSVFDSSNPIGLLESVINFMSSHCDFLGIDSSEEKMVSLVRAAKEGASMDEKAKRKPEAEAFADKVAEGKKKRELLVPNRHKGADMEDYSWEQNLHEVLIAFPVPSGTELRQILCMIGDNSVKIGLKGAERIVDGETFESVKSNDCIWSLNDKNIVSVVMPKIKANYWKSLLKGGPEIDFQKPKPESNELYD